MLLLAVAVSGGFTGSSAVVADEPDELLTAGEASLVRVDQTYIADTLCLPDLSVRSLSTMFDTEPGGIIGADYPRTLALPNGNVLWTFQDARIRTPTGARYVHNIGIMQVGTCFSILVGGSSSSPRAWLFPDQTAPEFRWFWPLDAEMGADGQVYVFSVEMNERGDRYLARAEPGGTFVARVNPDNWNVEWYGTPANAGNDLYGWSIESDDEWTYLFAHCHRQFGFDPFFGNDAHDRSCTDRVTVGRVPLGALFEAPTYWTGSSWNPDRSRAKPVIPRSDRFSNPTQVIQKNGRWLAVTKVDDWWGTEILIESAVHPTGPYTTVERRPVSPKCAVDCNTYFSSWIEGQNSGRPNDPLIISLSHNRWDGEASYIYRPTYAVVAPPADQPTVAMRCSLGYCA
ncbi:MAG: hypothetical protein WA964_04080 [Ilumatobacter sp.]|uniref:hypothetical protein n=1 Tax=Ilumatobacter sp. TaxID=1967498 RepID=UPI003C72EC35